MAEAVESAVRDLITVRHAAMEARLQRALQRREQLRTLLNAGMVPVGNPRYDWLLVTMDSLLYTLERLAGEFNRANPDDLITVHDLIDALATTQHNLVAKAKAL